MISTRLEESGGVSGELLTEHERVLSRNKLFQLGPSCQQRLVTQVFAVQMKKVEGTEDQFLRLPPNSLFERLKVRDPTLILNNHLAVDDCGAAVKLARCLCYAEVAFAPIEAIAGSVLCAAR